MKRYRPPYVNMIWMVVIQGDLFNNAAMTYFTGIHHATFATYSL